MGLCNAWHVLSHDNRETTEIEFSPQVLNGESIVLTLANANRCD